MTAHDTHTADTARRILANIEATYQSTHQYVPADLRDFPWLDHAFYDRTTRGLESAGFRRLGDIEDRTVSEAPGSVIRPTVVRTLTSIDGVIQAALYDVRARVWWLRVLLLLFRKMAKPVVDMETELTDGSFVVTCNAALAAAMTLPSLVSAEYLPAGTPAAAVYERHRLRVSEALAARPGVAPRPARTLEELMASQHRLEAIKAAHRGEVGGITLAELEALSPAFSRTLAADVHAAVQEERQRRVA
jgi:hypothetical protein